jgi:tripartite-type tricarboxylate transporter receptor subunit TctC
MRRGENSGMRAKRYQINRKRSIALALLAIALALASAVRAEDYPARPVKIVVAFPPGGTADAVPRLLAERLSRKWGQTVFIENKPGAGGNIGAEAVANAEPDGYTLFASPPPPLVINQNLYPKLGYDPSAFVPISVMATVPNALIANPNRIAATTVPDFIAFARAHRGKITVATQGNGTTSHLTAALFQMMTKVSFVMVPYRGSAPALQGLMAGDVDIMFDNLGVSLALAKSGQLRLIAVGSDTRLGALPDVPTIAETLPGFASSAWYAVVAPPRTPQPIADKIAADIAEALKDDDIKKRLAELSAVPIGSDPRATAQFLRAEIDRWNAVIKAANVRLE